jgi:hypothetical protein
MGSPNTVLTQHSSPNHVMMSSRCSPFTLHVFSAFSLLTILTDQTFSISPHDMGTIMALRTPRQIQEKTQVSGTTGRMKDIFSYSCL